MQSGQGKCVGYVNLAISLFSCSFALSRSTTLCYFLCYFVLQLVVVCFCGDCCCAHMHVAAAVACCVVRIPFAICGFIAAACALVYGDDSARCSNERRKAKRGVPQMAKYPLLLCTFCLVCLFVCGSSFQKLLDSSKGI